MESEINAATELQFAIDACRQHAASLHEAATVMAGEGAKNMLGLLIEDVCTFAARHAEAAPIEWPEWKQKIAREHAPRMISPETAPAAPACKVCGDWGTGCPECNEPEPAKADAPEQMVEVVARRRCVREYASRSQFCLSRCGGTCQAALPARLDRFRDEARDDISALRAAGAIAGPGHVVVPVEHWNGLLTAYRHYLSLPNEAAALREAGALVPPGHVSVPVEKMRAIYWLFDKVYNGRNIAPGLWEEVLEMRNSLTEHRWAAARGEEKSDG